MTQADLVEYATRRLSAGDNAATWAQSEIDLNALVPSALAVLARDVARDDVRRGLLQQDFEVTLDSSGIGNLLTATGSITADADILFEGVTLGIVKDASSVVLRKLTHYADFVRPQPTVFGYYCLTGERIHTRAVNVSATNPAEISGAASPLTIRANFEPYHVADVPRELEDDLVTALVTLVARKGMEKAKDAA